MASQQDDPALIARAFELADESMIERIKSVAVRSDEHGVLWGFVAWDGSQVADSSLASPYLQEAVAWLSLRGLCEVIEEPGGECILMIDEDDTGRPY
ncbi:hypothetical protein [Uliginosibacterium sediminicola]|uniref:Uncharacterized protein n=1 Tax=Uliginosibacterium sediminicola TaxID=2024550 RepID=A0ABU9YW03_9RHOO